MVVEKESFHGKGNGVSRQTYLVTLDLPEKMQAFVKKGLKIPDAPFFHNIQTRLVQNLQEILPQYNVETIQCSDLYNGLAVFVHELTNKSEMLVVSTVSELVDKLGGVHLQVNRIVDRHGDLLGIGSRPGYSSISVQFGEIIFHANQWPLLLLEDGSFSGRTVCTVLEMCAKSNIRLNFLVIGVIFSGAREAITKVQGDAKLHALHEWKKGDFVDWLPDYDFFPFIPNSGRVVGDSYNGTILPIYLHNGLSLSMPYILPYGRPVEWASLPKDKRTLAVFSLNRVHDAMAIFEEMEGLNHRPIIIEDLLGTYPRASFAVTSETHDFPEEEARILDFLSDDAHYLC